MATGESLTPAAEFEVVVSGLLSTYAPSASDTTSSRASTAYPDDVFDKVAKYLIEAGKQQWSLRPRTYVVLRLINRLDSMPAFILDGLFDIAFPYTYNRLPASLSPGARNAFLDQQSVVLSKAGDLEIEHGRHRHFPSTAEPNFVVVKQLGSGYFGVVDHVRSKLSLEEYARKRTVRARTFSKDKKALKVFENELSNLKRLSHRHLVKYVGSYTDPHYIGLLISPVADCDLRVFLTQTQFPHNLISCLRSFLGCLCSAVSYLHSQKCRHKDIKPGNILVRGDVVLITDFGTSRNWSDRSRGTTTGESGPYTPGYAAPEVVAWEARNESSDIWSLGCVFLDILTVLKGETLKTKDLFFGDNGNGGKNPRVNPQALTLWLSKLSKSGDEDSQPIFWIQQMLQVGPKDRISSVCLLDAILGYADQYIYYGHCCADHEEEVSSCNSSECLDDDSVSIGAEESTNATSVGSEVEGRKLPSTNMQRPGEGKPPVPQYTLDEFLGVAQGLRNISTTPLSDDSTSQSAPADTITPARPQLVDSNVVSVPTRGENMGRPSPGPGAIPILHSRNPFRPGYTPSPLLGPAQPQLSSSERLAHTQNRPSSFWTTLDDNSAVHEVRNDGRDSFISRAWPLNVDTSRPETSPNDASSGADTSQSSSAYQHTIDGASNSADNLYPLRDAAAKGDVPALLKYSLAGSNLNEGALGRSAFHAAGVNNQRTIMQLLLDLGCPVYPSDVADYILPMVGTGELTVDPLKPVHRLVVEQIDSIRKGQVLVPMRRDQEERFLPSRGNVPDDAVSLQGYSDVYDHVHRKTTSTSNAIDVRRNDFSNPAHLPMIGPWDTAGFHWDLKVRPDPEAMHEAIRRGYVSEVINCLNEGYVVHLRDEDDRSPLDIAISCGLISIIELLISYGANPKAVDSQGKDAYAKSRYRFFGLELDQVLDLLDRSKDYNPYARHRPNQPQLPTTVHTPWAHFLAQQNQEHGSYGYDSVPYDIQVPGPLHEFTIVGGANWLKDWQVSVPVRFQWLVDDEKGELIWYEWPQPILEPYPYQVFELADTSFEALLLPYIRSQDPPTSSPAQPSHGKERPKRNRLRDLFSGN